MSTNKFLRRLKYEIWPSRSIEYIGCPALNLGDQAVFLAVSRTFRDVTVAYPKHPGGRVGRALRQWENRQKRLGTMLGGGTMIGAATWSVNFAQSYEESLKLSGLGFAFGTGVAENHFPPDNEFFVSDPSNYYRWANLLKQSRYVGVRGPRSQASLAELGVTSEVLGDTACALVAPERFWQPKSGHLGLNVGHGGGSMWGERAQFNATMGRFVAIATKQGWKIDFFALMDDDIDIIKEVARMGGIANPRIFREYSDPDRYMAQVRKMRAFIGMKLHSVILAMCAHVPSIMLEYRPKGLDFMASVGLEHFNVRTSDVEPKALFDMLFQLVDQGPHFSEIIRTRLTEYKRLQETRARELIAVAEQITSRQATAS